MSLNGGSSRDAFTVGDRALLNRVAALLDRGAPGSQHTPDTQSLRLTVLTTGNHGFSAGSPVYYTGTAWAKALATNADPALLPVGLVEQATTSRSFTVVLSGLIRGLSGLTAGRLYYVTAAGALSLTPDPSNRIPVLYTLTTTTGLVLGTSNRSNLVMRRVGWGSSSASSVTNASSGFVGALTGDFAIYGPFRCDFSAWATTASTERHIIGNAMVRWDADSAIWDIVYQGMGMGPGGGASNHTAGASPPSTASGMAVTLTITGGAGGAYTAITDVTATISGIPAAPTAYGVSLSVDAPGMVSGS